MSDEKKPAPTVGEVREANRALQKAGESMMWTAGFIALPWLKVRAKAEPTNEVENYAIAADGTLKVNPRWWATQRPEERVFELAASMMTVLLRHHDRGVALGIVNPADGTALPGQEHNHTLWNKARAAVVNLPLQQDSIGRAPADAVYPPADYKGRLDAESLYYHLLKTEPPPPPQGNGGQQPQGDGDDQQPPSGGGNGSQPPHAGGNVQPPPGGGQGEGQGEGETPTDAQGTGLDGDDLDQMRREVEALARQAGRGTHVVEALKPKVARTNYRQVIGAGLDVANTEASERTQNTYSRASRREGLLPGLILPGKIGTDPSICVVIDFSGSTQHYAQKFVDHAQKVATDYPNVRIYLVAHTDRVTFEGWLRPGGDAAKLTEASKHSGGTSFAPAYEAARAVAPRGKFDSLCHFTDGFNCGAWPLPPARRFVVGLCGTGEGTTPLPMPAKVIPVTVDGQ